MCKGCMHELLKKLPKCEHHMHIEGSLEPDLLFELGKKNNVSLPPASEDEAFASVQSLLARYDRFSSLDDFLHYYFIGMSVLVTADDFEQLAMRYFQRASQDGLVHAEIFFDPQAHIGRDVEYHTVVEGLSRAQARAEKELGITSELIVCILRNFSPEAGRELYDTALPDLKSGKVKGLGLSGTEKNRRPKLFEKTYLQAERDGIYRTSHAGEEGDASYIAEAIAVCHCQRIDHGVKLNQDLDLMKQLAAQKILVTACPLSNVALKVMGDVREGPLQDFMTHNVHFSINSDDPAYFRSYILENYCAVQDAFNFSAAQWATIAENSIKGSWCSKRRKEQMLNMLSDTLAQWEASGSGQSPQSVHAGSN